MKIKGVTLYPKTVENAILELKDIVNYQIEAYTGTDHTDRLRLRVGCTRNDSAFRQSLLEHLRAKARITLKVDIESPDEINKRLFDGNSRKAITFKDNRVQLI